MQNFRNRMGWALSGALALVLIATLARAIQAGPLDPPGPVGSTMKTIGDLVPSWHQTLSSSGGCTSQRFSCVMGGAAVLDNETGLVWEKTPSNTAGENWFAAQASCTSASTGSRLGWRLPAVEELQTLRDLSTVDGLPSGHPFSGVSGGFWSTSSGANDERNAQSLTFPAEFGPPQTAPKEFAVAGAWCVRGGRGDNAQTPSDLNSWSKKLPATGLDSCHTRRFTCVLANNEGVLDHETGLVWTRALKLYTSTNHYFALSGCANATEGNVGGWRLPTAPEMLSLQDPTQVNPNPSLPLGHPFIGSVAVADLWWTSSLPTDSPGIAYVVRLEGPSAGQNAGTFTSLTTAAVNVWCVRGAVTQ